MKKNVAKDMNPSIFFYEDYFDNIFFTLIPAAATPVEHRCVAIRSSAEYVLN